MRRLISIFLTIAMLVSLIILPEKTVRAVGGILFSDDFNRYTSTTDLTQNPKDEVTVTQFNSSRKAQSSTNGAYKNGAAASKMYYQYGKGNGGYTIQVKAGTKGYSNIKISYVKSLESYSAGAAITEWSTDNSTWNIIDTTTANVTKASFSTTLPATADNKTNFYLRFRVDVPTTNSSDYANGYYIDDIVISGEPETIPPVWTSATLTASQVTNTSITLNWSGASDASGVTNYRIYSNGTIINTVSGSVYNVTGLMPSTQYTFKIEAGDCVGNWSIDGPTLTVSTAGIVDTVPPIWLSSNLTISDKKQHSLRLSWDGAQDNVATTQYKIFKDGSPLDTVASSVYSYNVYELTPDTNYIFKVEAGDASDNWTTNGPSKEVKTLSSSESFFNENFEGSNPLNGWTLSTSGGTIEVGDDPTQLNGRSLLLNDTSATNSVAAKKPVGEITGAITAEYKFMFKDAIKTMYLPVYGMATATGTTDTGKRKEMEFFRLSTTGTNVSYGNETGAYTTLGPISPDTWYNVRVVVDIAKEAFSLRVEGPDGVVYTAAAKKLYNKLHAANGYGTPEVITNVGFYTKSTDTETLLIDDIFVYDTDKSLAAPEWPAGSSLTASAVTKKEMTLAWTEAKDYIGIENYMIYKDDVLYATVPGTSKNYVVKGLDPETEYTFKVRAKDGNGTLSSSDLVLKISTLPKDELVPPVWPQGSSLTASDVDATTLKLTWTPATDNTGVTNYKVYKNGTLLATLDGTVVSYDVKGLEMNTSYTFAVQAGDDSNNWSVDGPSVTVSTIGDAKPPVWTSQSIEILYMSRTDVDLMWTGVTDNVGVTEFRIYEDGKQIGTTSEWITIKDSYRGISCSSKSGWVFRMSGLTPGEKHTITIQAGDAAGNWTTTGATRSFKPFDYSLPVWQPSKALTESNKTASDVTLHWDGASDDGKILSYRIYKDDALEATVAGSVYSYEVQGLVHDTAYDFKVQAVDAMNNESIDGPVLKVVTASSSDTTAPAWVNGSLTASGITTDGVTLSWKGASDASGITGYRIYDGSALVAAVEGSADHYSVSGLATGSQYTFTVQAGDAAGNWSVNGPAVSVTTELVTGTTKYVSSIEELNTAMLEANPGDIVIINDGIYETGTLVPIIGKNGLPNAPIVIKAANPRQAEIKAATGFYFKNSSYVTIEGIKFTGKLSAVNRQSAVSMQGCNNMRITQCHFAMDESQVIKEPGFTTIWVAISSSEGVVSHHNRIDRNLFEKKPAPGQMIEINGDSQSLQISQYDIIEYNYFKDTKDRIDNGKETIRYGTSGVSQSSSFGILQYNVFEECDGDPEFVSIKASDTTIRYNTFLNSAGQLTFRHGDRNTAYGNYFIGDGKKTGVGGMRIYGTDHKIYGNYFQGLTMATMNIDGGDDYDFGLLTGKLTIRRADISFNTIIDCTTGITVWGGRSYAPQGVTVANNLVINSGGISYTSSKSAVQGIPTPRPVYAGNIVYPTNRVTTEANEPKTAEEVRIVDPRMTVMNSVYRLSASSPAIDAAVGSYRHINEDMDGQPRIGLKDVGADEYSTEPVIRKMLSGADVASNGPSDRPYWVSGAITTSEITKDSMKLTWSAAKDDDRVTQYRIYSGNTQVQTVTGNDYSCIITGLTPNQQYTFTVQAGDAAGNWTTDGPTVTVKTLDITPTADTTAPTFSPGALKVSDKTRTSITLVWSAATDDVAVTGYSLYKGSELIAVVAENVLSYTVTGLTSNTEYTFTVKAGDAAGNWTTNAPSITVKTEAKKDSDGSTGSGTAPVTPTTPTPPTTPTTTVVKSDKPVVDVKTGEAKVTVDRKALEEVLKKTDVVTVEIPEATGAKAYTVVLAVDLLASSDASKKVEIKTELGTVTVPGNMAKVAETGTAKEVGIRIANAGTSTKPVVEFGITVEGKTVEYNNPNAPVYVKIPYQATAAELANPEHIVILQVDGTGKVLPVPSGKYDAATGIVTFTTTHSGQYAVDYVKKTFDDIADYNWAQKQIEVLASKGIINGKSESTFDPGAEITRADFTLLLIKSLGLTAKADTNFGDVKPEDYYYKEVGIAKALGIVRGEGEGSFNPEENITRQDMMTIAARAMIYAKKAKASADSEVLKQFADRSSVASYAVESASSLVAEGLIQGGSGMLNPLGNATRAEIAVLMYRIYNK